MLGEFKSCPFIGPFHLSSFPHSFLTFSHFTPHFSLRIKPSPETLLLSPSSECSVKRELNKSMSGQHPRSVNQSFHYWTLILTDIWIDRLALQGHVSQPECVHACAYVSLPDILTYSEKRTDNASEEDGQKSSSKHTNKKLPVRGKVFEELKKPLHFPADVHASLVMHWLMCC